jgi:hypothetical protein
MTLDPRYCMDMARTIGVDAEMFRRMHRVKILAISQSYRCPDCGWKSELLQFAFLPSDKLSYAVCCSNLDCDRATAPAKSEKEAWHLWDLVEALER